MNDPTNKISPDDGLPVDAAAEAKALAGEAMDRLAQKDRVLTEATMASKSKPLTDEQIFTIRRNAQDYLKKHKITQTTVAAQTGFSGTVISEWFCERYAGNVQKVAHAVNDWVERDAQRRAARRQKDYVPTRIAETIRSVIRRADARCRMLAIVAPSGSGKTYVALAMCEEMRGVYLRCDNSKTPREFLLALAQELGRTKRGGTRSETLRWIVQTLAGTSRMIFLDEAHLLPPVTFDCIRAIHDTAHVPITMLGATEILNFCDDKGQGHGQFSRRTTAVDLLEPAARAGSGDAGRRGNAQREHRLFSVEEVRAFFDSKKIKLHREALDLLWRLANLPDWGCVGFIEQVCESALGVRPEGDSTAISREDVLRGLGIEQPKHLSRILQLAEDEDAADADLAAAAIVA